MLSLEVFLLGLLITSTLTSLVTEAVKKIMTEYNKTYRANTLVGIVALLLSVAIGCGYIVLAGLEFTSAVIICLIANDMIIRTVLPNILAIFLVAKSLEGGNKPGNDGILQCRDRRPRRSFLFHK